MKSLAEDFVKYLEAKSRDSKDTVGILITNLSQRTFEQTLFILSHFTPRKYLNTTGKGAISDILDYFFLIYFLFLPIGVERVLFSF